MERLQKVIANAGITSRRKAEELILNGKVKVNGKTVSELGIKVDSKTDDIRVNDEQIFVNHDKIVILFNKPTKVITSLEDPQGRKTVIDFISVQERVYPVGRLDYETEGLLLLTNDGEFANRLMHPSYEMDKTYEVILNGILSNEEIKQLRRGVPLKDGVTSPAEVSLIEKSSPKKSKINITIHEGRNRQVRRMIEYFGYKVLKLKRIKYAFLTIHGVPTGQFRYLTNKEICELKNTVGLKC